MGQFQRRKSLDSMLRERVVVLDGAMGTNIQTLNLKPDDFGGPDYDGCNEYLNLVKLDPIRDIHRSFLQAGADIIETNSFGATPLVLSEYSQGHRAMEINRVAAEIARDVAEEFSTKEWPRFVAGSMGPTTKAISVTGGVTWDELAEHYRVQAVGLILGGVDVLLIETAQDILNVKAALEGIDCANREMELEIPVAVQCTIETMGTTLAGQDIEAFYTALSHRDLLWVGLNCATGPGFMRDHLRTLAAISRFPIAVIPNAGLPDHDGNYNETPDLMAETIAQYLDAGWANIVGGCCGSTPEHIERLCEISRGRVVPDRDPIPVTVISGLESLVINEDTRPVVVGERTNVLGSRRFKRLIAEDKIEEAAEIGRHQVRDGAHVLDVCLQDPDRNEMLDVTVFLQALTLKVKAPLVIDSTDPIVIEQALKLTPGKSVINSINLEDGEEKFKTVVPLARRYGAAFIVGCIDDDQAQAQAITRERKLEVAQRSHKLLTEKYGVAPEDIIVDPLVFPIGTGDENYSGAGVETIEGVRLIKEKLPQAKTILGISNVSFGLPPAGREVLNSVFLYHCVQAGLDMAIVNSERMMRFASISDEDKKICEDLIWWNGTDPIRAFADHFRARKPEITQVDRRSVPVDKRVANCVIEGTKEGLFEDLDELLIGIKPLDIINGPLMDGMDEVGRLFGRNELIVAEVLQSAESMKAAVTYLESYMESSEESSSRGTILLATVKGDVHDIGKNLVDIILSNNGYKVINLGIRVSPFDLIEACMEHKPDIVGLSGLLVKSAQMMVETVKDFKVSGLQVPILVGGAALTNRFTRLRIAPQYEGLVLYCPDAMRGLEKAGELGTAPGRQRIAEALENESERLLREEEIKQSQGQDKVKLPKVRSTVAHVVEPPRPPDLKLHMIQNADLTEIFSYINPTMLYVRHLGFRGRFTEQLKQGNAKAKELRQSVQEVEEVMLSRPDIMAKAVYRFFRTASDGDDVVILTSDGKEEYARFQFGRQERDEGLCLADYLRPLALGVADYMGMFVTSIGPGVRDLAESWKNSGEFLKSHILQALALEGAEAFAEFLHKRMRAMWGIADSKPLTPEDLFKTKYQGRRYSFGYPACPRLEDQSILWSLLNPDRHIEVELTEEYMMEPEASVSAIVLHHPEAKYFNLRENELILLEKRIRR